MSSGKPESPKYPAAVDTTAAPAPDSESAPRPLPHTAAVRSEMEQSDREMIRVYEDLIDLLIGKNLLLLTDLPPAAQDKLLRRKRLRAMLSPLADIIDADEDETSIP
jgi:hypothetical protein